jgi:hypothetical protein
MYIALSHPGVPEYKATVKLTPVEEPMKIRTHYKKESVWSRGACQFLMAVWFLILTIYLISII